MNYIRRLVLRRFFIDFAHVENRDSLFEILESCCKVNQEKSTIQLAILFLSKGSPEELCKLVNETKQDPSHILNRAGLKIDLDTIEDYERSCRGRSLLPMLPDIQNHKAKIWRFMDLSKFLPVISQKMLYFPRSDVLNDPFEASYPKENLPLGNGVLRQLAENISPDIRQGKLSSYASTRRLIQSLVYVCSWHINEYESDAMWRLYTSSNLSVAIKSSVERLVAALPPEVLVCNVKYLDFNSEKIPDTNVLYPFLYKRNAFQHENELRAIIFDPSDQSCFDRIVDRNGIGVMLSLDVLIDAIHLCPTAPSWFRDAVESLIYKFGYEFRVNYSSLDDDPTYPN